MALGLQIALLISVVITTCVFTVVACSDPGVVFESYEAPTAVQVGDAELGSGVICGACLLFVNNLILVKLFRLRERDANACDRSTTWALVILITVCVWCARLYEQHNARFDGRTTRHTARTAASA